MPETGAAEQGDGALVLFSGGQDSATCLAWALHRFPHAETLGFDYGQRHRVELDRRAALWQGLSALDPVWAGRLGPDDTLPLAALGEISDKSMTGKPGKKAPAVREAYIAAAESFRRGRRHEPTIAETSEYQAPSEGGATANAFAIAGGALGGAPPLV